jgi:ribosome-associated heat shock protein Hsp15
MRIDKFLWCTRYYKTRGLAADAIKKGQIKVNQQVAKASREVFASDKIIIRKDQINYETLVLDIPPSRVSAKLVDIYRKDETPKEAFEHLEMLKLNKELYREKGTGRPTKKERRDIDDYTDNDSEWQWE